ncbi:heparan-alpha-glucosaminide N-acetyltransferase domain-containing protein [Bacillus thuringiensis]|uniref:heparan-alpha-glucosaminide N-acetyltransferase domain-containing protein n=1 Tax=Bacillus thuringiensis TaxID=1428 RepID=UPI0016423916|nr:heparan-alpha-glucosaminide N-acetyltransferase domain-containing protein [Bacillus thuringiensis]
MFSKEKINTGRQVELDIARGLAVLFMIFIHAQLYFANKSVVNSSFGEFNDFVGDMPAAPMFMFLLGVGMNYTRKNNPSLMFKRGIMLILIGYLLNLIRGFVPYTIRAYYSMDITYLYEGITELLYVDILQFSGLAMIMFGLFNQFNVKNFTIILTVIGLSVINVFMLNVPTDKWGLSAITGLVWGSNENSYFPFLTWVFYPIAGFLFGSLLIRCTNKKKFYIRSAIIGAVIFFSGTYLFNVVFGIPTGLESDIGYYHHFITDNITFTGFILLEISILSFLAPLVPKFVQTIVARWSKNVTPIFCIHWVIITWATLIITPYSLNMFWFVLFLIVIVPLSDCVAYIYSNRKNRKIKQYI